jgi:thiamine monophosphate synthase
MLMPAKLLAEVRGTNASLFTATVKSIELAAFMDQAGSDYVLAGRVLHTGSIVLTHAVT